MKKLILLLALAFVMCGCYRQNADGSWHFEGEHIDDTPHKYFQKMLACYNPDNRYIVDYVYGTETGSADVYLYEGEYYLGWDCRINKDYITKVTKK